MKIFSSVHIDISGSLKGLKAAVYEALENGAKGLFVFLGSRHEFDIQALVPLFASLPVPAYAGVFPGIIYDVHHYDKGVLVCGFTMPLSARIIQDLVRPGIEITNQLADWLTDAPAAGAVVMIDGQSPGVDNVVSCIHDCLGPDARVMGGGTGYLDFSHRPTIITAEGCYKNACLIAGLPVPLAFGVRHGWESVAGPFLVTRSKDKLIQSINYEPAFPFYEAAVRECCPGPVDFTDFFNMAKSYPLGLAQLDNEFLVRDPLQRRGNAIECAGSVPQNALIYILNSHPEKLIRSAAKAANGLMKKLPPINESRKPYYTFVVDCISRRLFLGEEYGRELKEIKNELPVQMKIAGVLTLGEIASSPQGVIRFLNKTTVIGGIGC